MKGDEAMNHRRKSRKLRSVLSVLLAAIMVVNTIVLSDLFTEPETAEAAGETLNAAEIISLWEARRDSLGWCDADNKPLPAMWQDTSELSTAWIATTEDAGKTGVNKTAEPKAAIAGSIGQRIEFEDGASLSDYVYEDAARKVSDYSFGGVSVAFSDEAYAAVPTDPTELQTWEGWNDDNAYDAATNPSLTAWKIGKENNDTIKYVDLPYVFTQNETDVPALYYTVEYDAALEGCYRRYYVSTADQLALLLNAYQSKFASLTAAAAELPAGKTAVKKVGVELLCDLDLGGADDSRWYGYRNPACALEIKGSGHSVYNGYLDISLVTRVKYYVESTTAGRAGTAAVTTTEYGVLLRGDKYFSIEDVTFSHLFIPNAGGAFGAGVSCGHFQNVDFTHCMAVAESTGVAIVLGFSYSTVYFKNCTVSDSYVKGRGHASLFSSYDLGMSPLTVSGGKLTSYATYLGDSTVDSRITGYYFTEVPSLEDAERAWYGKKWEYGGETVTLCSNYPSIYENCAALDSEVYDVLEHSGTFVSCYQGSILFRECFTNCSIYAQSKIGSFAGCAIGSGNGFYYPVQGERTLVNSVFESCYASGAAEGQNWIGGFIGSIYNDVRSQASDYRGQVVFENCYSTSSAGMQYSGNYVGGFVGLVHANQGTATDALTDEEQQHLFINCYAAGEVGGITTDTTAEGTQNTIGGFLGGYEWSYSDSTLLPLRLQNCYYDRQTTAMREREIGAGLHGTLSELTGVYTRSSEQKGVGGLTDTVEMNGGLAAGETPKWSNRSGQFYPQLLAWATEPERGDYPEGLAGDMLYERQLKFYYYSLASTAAVFLDHYDNMLDETGAEVPAGIEVYDTVRDITRKFTFTTDDGNGIAWKNDNTAGSRNELSGFVEKMGQQGADDTGFSLSYDSDLDGAGDVSQSFDPNVLVIGEYDGVYKCLDFAPGKQWVTVTASRTLSETEGETGVTGKRELRLLPTAYLNAGNIIHINVAKEETGGAADNAVTFTDDNNNEILLNGLFNHSVGVAYAITDRYRMGTSSVYEGQKLSLYEAGASKTETGSFAFYAPYSVTDPESQKLLGVNTTGENGVAISGMLEQNIAVKATDSIYNLSYSGKTMVKVYKAVPQKSGDSTELVKSEEVDYAANDNLAKWQGETPFTLDDVGYYYLDYYWRLDDGRYLTDSRLVRITANSYSVEVITGILGSEHTVDENGAPRTSIDQYVTDEVTRLGSEGAAGSNYAWTPNFPSILLQDADYVDNDDFTAESAASYYNTYNKPLEYNGDTYYTKSLKQTTVSPVTAVGWYRNNDYKLTTLIIEAIDQYGVAHEMARVDSNADEQFNFSNAEYSYDFTTYTVTQDKETKLYTITENSSVPISFKIEAASRNATNSVTKYVVFDFATTGDNQEGYTQINDSLRVTALFRENTANIIAEKTVLLNPDEELLPDDSEPAYYESLSEHNKESEADNSALSEEEASDDRNRKAVLAGDVLTYRVKLHNAGYFDSDRVQVRDAVPEGCTYVSGSMKLYRQSVHLSDGTAKYGALELLGSESGCELKEPGDDGALEWTIPSISLDYQYYAEFQVTVGELRACDLRRVLTNTATWDFICRNGDVTGDYNAPDLETLKQDSIFSMDMDVEEDSEETQKRTYTIEFSQNDAENLYTNIVFINNFPDKGFCLIEDADGAPIKLYKEETQPDGSTAWVLQDTNADGQPELTVVYDADGQASYFTVKNLSFENKDERYRIVFTGTQVLLGNEGITEISNKASITYTKYLAEGGNIQSDRQGNSISKVERISNEVVTDVTHLYLQVQKEIAAKDFGQSFLFRITYFENEEAAESGASGEISYVRVNCTESAADENGNAVYIGSRLLQCGKRGVYRVEELAEWSASDYDFGGAAAYALPTRENGLRLYPTEAFRNGTAEAVGRAVTLTLPGIAYSSGAFPTSLGTVLTEVPTAEFTNTESEYAYLSGQSYAENNFSCAETGGAGN